MRRVNTIKWKELCLNAFSIFSCYDLCFLKKTMAQEQSYILVTQEKILTFCCKTNSSLGNHQRCAAKCMVNGCLRYMTRSRDPFILFIPEKKHFSNKSIK